MGNSATGKIWFGVVFDEDYQFPWMEEPDSDADMDEWWEQHYDGTRCPFQVVPLGTFDGSWYGIAVRKSIKASVGYEPVALRPIDLMLEGGSIAHLKDFIKDWGLKPRADPSWYLSTFWG